MRSIIWRLVPLVAVLSVLLEHSLAVDEGNIYNVRQLTTLGKHSFPRLSADYRYVYYSAQGSGYGTKGCDDIYKLDLKYYNETHRNWKISRVSPGFGHSSHVDVPRAVDGSLMYASTYHKLYDDINIDPAAGTSNFLCPTSVCTAGNTIIACGAAEPIEYYDDTNIYSTDAFGRVTKQEFSRNKNSYYTCPKRGFTSVVHTEPLKSGDDPNIVDGAYPFIGAASFIQTTDPEPLGYFEGVDYGTTSATPAQNVAFFHGKPDAGHATADEGSYSKNVFDPTNTKIYKTNVDAAGNRVAGQAATVFLDPATSNLDLQLWPQSYKSGSQVIFSGRTAAAGQEVIYTTIPQPGAPPALVALTDANKNSKQAALSVARNQMVFVRQASATADYQLYIADLNPGLVQPTYDDLPYADASAISTDNIIGKKSVSLPGRIGKVRAMEVTGDLIFEYNPNPANTPQCKQVYHVDTTLNDFSNPRLLSSGLGEVDGLDLYEKSDSSGISKYVIYSSDFIKAAPSAQNQMHGCDLDVCDKNRNPDPKLQDFCNRNQGFYKYLGNDFEIYQADIFGSFVKRITQNSVYDGQPVVSPDQSKMIFTRSSGDRVDLILKDLNDDTKADQLLTESLSTGYFDSATWSPDGKYVAFHGYEVADDNTLEFRRMLSDFNIVSTQDTKIYLARLSDGKVYEVSSPEEATTPQFFYNPAFSSSKTLVYESTLGGGFFLYEYSINTGIQQEIFEATGVNPRKASFVNKNRQYLTFSSEANDGKTPPTYTSSIFLTQYIPTNAVTTPTPTPSTPPMTSKAPHTKPGTLSSVSVNPTTSIPLTTTASVGSTVPTAFVLLITSMLLVFGRH